MQDKKVAIVVCGIKNHIILLNKLKARGFHTILVDGAENPVAKEAADEFAQIDIFDFDGIKALAVERNAQMIINACQEHLNTGICRICEELGLAHPYSYETALAISDKERMKTRMRDFGIPTTPFICVSAKEEIAEIDLEYPLYVKSCAGSGSTAVNRANTYEEVLKFTDVALQRYPGKRVIIEEEAKGKEYAVYCFPCNGKANVLLIFRRYTDNNSEDRVTKLLSIWSPPLISERAKENIIDTAEKITKAFALDNTPMFMQIMVDGENVNVIEFAGRIGGGFGYQAIMAATEFDYFEATINSFMGIYNEDINYHQADGYITVSHVYGHKSIYGEMVGYQQLLDDGTLGYISLPRTRGKELKEDSANGCIVAQVINQDKTVDGLIAKIERTFNKLELYDVDGKQCLNRKLHLTRDLLDD